MAEDRLLAEVIGIVDGEVRQCICDIGHDDAVLDGDPDHQNSVTLTALAVIEAVRQHDLKEGQGDAS